MDMAHLISKKDDVVEYELNCPVCKKKVIISVDAKIAEESVRYPFEYVDIHGDPAHGITLYIDKNWAVRGMEIFKNINVQSIQSEPKIVRIPKIASKISPMARQLGIISNKEFAIIEKIDGKKDIDVICQELNKDFDYVFGILQTLVKKKLVKISKEKI